MRATEPEGRATRGRGLDRRRQGAATGYTWGRRGRRRFTAVKKGDRWLVDNVKHWTSPSNSMVNTWVSRLIFV